MGDIQLCLEVFSLLQLSGGYMPRMLAKCLPCKSNYNKDLSVPKCQCYSPFSSLIPSRLGVCLFHSGFHKSPGTSLRLCSPDSCHSGWSVTVARFWVVSAWVSTLLGLHILFMTYQGSGCILEEAMETCLLCFLQSLRAGGIWEFETHLNH